MENYHSKHLIEQKFNINLYPHNVTEPCIQSLESFVDQTIKEGREDIKDFDEFKKILDILDAKKKPIYLKYEVHVNT